MNRKKYCRRLRQRAVLRAFTALTHILGVPDKRFHWWAWEMTPIPLGFPSWRQYLDGMWFFLTGRIRESQLE